MCYPSLRGLRRADERAWYSLVDLDENGRYLPEGPVLQAFEVGAVHRSSAEGA